MMMSFNIDERMNSEPWNEFLPMLGKAGEIHPSPKASEDKSATDGLRLNRS